MNDYLDFAAEPGRKRFGWHEVKKGRFKGGLHYGGEKALRYRSELGFHAGRLSDRLFGVFPESSEMARILLTIDNVFEYEVEKVIQHFVKSNPSRRNHSFLNRLKQEFVSFKSKYLWLFQKKVLDKKVYSFLDTVHKLRNEFVHHRPSPGRKRHKYFNQPLMSVVGLQNLLIDSSFVLAGLARIHGGRIKWYFVPPGYVEDLHWQSVWPGVPGIIADRY